MRYQFGLMRKWFLLGKVKIGDAKALAYIQIES